MSDPIKYECGSAMWYRECDKARWYHDKGIWALTLVAVVIVALLSGFDKIPWAGGAGNWNLVRVYTDPVTGCEYLSKSGYGGMYPRASASGKQRGCKDERP